jgi:hypothetical protein
MEKKYFLFFLSAFVIIVKVQCQTLKSLRFKKVVVDGTTLMQIPPAPGVT